MHICRQFRLFQNASDELGFKSTDNSVMMFLSSANIFFVFTVFVVYWCQRRSLEGLFKSFARAGLRLEKDLSSPMVKQVVLRYVACYFIILLCVPNLWVLLSFFEQRELVTAFMAVVLILNAWCFYPPIFMSTEVLVSQVFQVVTQGLEKWKTSLDEFDDRRNFRETLDRGFKLVTLLRSSDAALGPLTLTVVLALLSNLVPDAFMAASVPFNLLSRPSHWFEETALSLAYLALAAMLAERTYRLCQEGEEVSRASKEAAR